MVQILSYSVTSTAGTKITSPNSGFVQPSGTVGVMGIAADGADGEYLEITFPRRGDHPFAREELPVTAMIGEIAVNTRIITPAEIVPGLPGFVPCYWRQKIDTQIDITPRGGESTDVKVIYVAYAEPGDIMQPAIHWMACDAITYGTTVANGRILDIDPGVSKLRWAAVHGAGMTGFVYRLRSKGQDYTLVGNHGAQNAAENPYSMAQVNKKLESKYVYFGDNTGHFTGTGVGLLYCGFVA